MAQTLVSEYNSPDDNALLLSAGYGYVPKAVMQDRRLPPSAKALYAYLCSFAGRSGVAFPGVEKIRYDMAMSRSAFTAHMRRLVETGYVRVERETTAGRFGRNVYILTGGQPEEGEPMPVYPTPKIPASEKRTLENRTANNNHPNNNRSKNNVPEEEEEGKNALPRGGMPADPARRRAIELAMALQAKPAASAEPAVRAFRGCFGREPTPAEREGLAGLLSGCESEALVDILRRTAEFAPAAPVPYLREAVRRARAEALRLGVLRSNLEPLTADGAARSEFLLDREGYGGDFPLPRGDPNNKIR